MNISRLIPVSSLQRKNNHQSTPIMYHGLKCDTVSFTGPEKLTYDDVLIYHDTFDSSYDDLEYQYKKNVDKKLEEIKTVNQVGNSAHGIRGCPGLNEFISSGKNAYRILFKIIDGTMVLISCLQKNLTESEADRIYDRARDLVKSGKLEDFVAQSKIQAEEEAQKAQEARKGKDFNKAQHDKSIEAKRFKSIIEVAQNELLEFCLQAANSMITEFTSKRADYLGDQEDLDEILEQITEQYSQLESIIYSLKYEEGDSEAKVNSKIKKVSDEAYKNVEIIEGLAQRGIDLINANSITTLEAKKQKINSLVDDINKIYKEIKSKTKKISTSLDFNEANAYYANLLTIQKEYNINVKRKAEAVAAFSGNETMQEVDEKLQSMLLLEDKALMLYSNFEKIIESYNARLASIEQQKAKQNVTSREQQKPKQNVASREQQNNDVDSMGTADGTVEDEEVNVDEILEALETEAPGILETLDEVISDANDVNDEITTVITKSNAPVRIYRFPDFEMTPYANKVLTSVEDNLSKTMLRACARDIALQLVHSIGQKQMNNLNKLSENEFVDLLTSQMEAISQTPQYQVAIRSMNIAFLNEVLLCSYADSDKIYNLQSSQINKLQESVLKGEKNITLQDEFNREFEIKLEGQPDLDEAQAYYWQLTEHLDADEIALLFEAISKYADGIPEGKLVHYLKTQGEYLSLITDETTPKALKNRLLRYVFADFDKINNTNFSQTALARIDKEGIETRINFFTSDEMLDDIDL